MLAQVTNRARGPRGFETLDRGIVLIEPGETKDLDLADHPLHRAWVSAGEIVIEPRETEQSADVRAASKRPGRGERKPG